MRGSLFRSVVARARCGADYEDGTSRTDVDSQNISREPLQTRWRWGDTSHTRESDSHFEQQGRDSDAD